METEESSSGETLEAKADGGEIPVEEADAGETSAGESTMEEMPAEEADLAELRPYLTDYCKCFGLNAEELLKDPFTVVTPDSRNPYRQMYVAN